MQGSGGSSFVSFSSTSSLVPLAGLFVSEVPVPAALPAAVPPASGSGPGSVLPRPLWDATRSGRMRNGSPWTLGGNPACVSAGAAALFVLGFFVGAGASALVYSLTAASAPLGPPTNGTRPSGPALPSAPNFSVPPPNLFAFEKIPVLVVTGFVSAGVMLGVGAVAYCMYQGRREASHRAGVRGASPA